MRKPGRKIAVFRDLRTGRYVIIPEYSRIPAAYRDVTLIRITPFRRRHRRRARRHIWR